MRSFRLVYLTIKTKYNDFTSKTTYKDQILNHTFENMLQCIFCNEFFDDKDSFIVHKIECDKKTLKKIPTDETGKNYCERCHKAFKFKDAEHTIVCNDTLNEYKQIEKEKDDLETEVQDLRILNRRLNDELFKFVGIVNKCINDYIRSKDSNIFEEEESNISEEE